jgi:hypothetical protein
VLAGNISLVRKCFELFFKSSFLFFCKLGFFLGAEVKDIRLGNMRSFLAWAMYSADFESLDEQEKAAIGAAASSIVSKTNLSLSEGYNPNVKHIKMTLNPISYVHRPCLLYLGSAAKNAFGDLILQYNGFKQGSVGGISYWCKGTGTEETPMLFFHGITTGWIFYLPLILTMAQSRPVLLIDLDTIKIHSLVFDMPDEKEFVDAVRDICTRHFGSDTRVSVVGHSFGTILAAWFLRGHPTLVSHLTLLDPGM